MTSGSQSVADVMEREEAGSAKPALTYPMFALLKAHPTLEWLARIAGRGGHLQGRLFGSHARAHVRDLSGTRAIGGVVDCV